MLLILLISNPKDSSYGGDIIINEQYKHSIEINESHSEFQNKFSNDIPFEFLDLENINRNTYHFMIII